MLRSQGRKGVRGGWQVEEIVSLGQLRPTVFIPGTQAHAATQKGRLAKARGFDFKVVFIQNPHKGTVMLGIVTQQISSGFTLGVRWTSGVSHFVLTPSPSPCPLLAEF